MEIRHIVEAAFELAGVTAKDVAQAKGWYTGQVTSRLARNSMKASEFFDIMDMIGIDVKLVKRDNGEIVKPRIKGHGPRIQMMVDKVEYDTAKCDALANSFYADGENEFNDEFKATELYIDQEGRYFFAEYTNWEGGKNRISPTTAAVAAAFIEKYGTQIEKKHIE